MYGVKLIIQGIWITKAYLGCVYPHDLPCLSGQQVNTRTRSSRTSKGNPLDLQGISLETVSSHPARVKILFGGDLNPDIGKHSTFGLLLLGTERADGNIQQRRTVRDRQSLMTDS